MKLTRILLFLCALMPLSLFGQTNLPPDMLPQIKSPPLNGFNSLALVLIPALIPVAVRLCKMLIPKIPDWFLPILAPCLGVLANYVSSLSGGPSIRPVLAFILGAAGTGFREIKDQVQTTIKSGMAKSAASFLLLCSLLLLPTGCANFWHPENLKPVPVAVGEDAVIVNAERVQVTSLFAYEKLINWEYKNRSILPVEVSRAVDKARKEFLPNWKESREALKVYKELRGGNLDNVNRLTAAFSAAQTSFLQTVDSHGKANDIISSLSQLADSIQTLKN